MPANDTLTTFRGGCRCGGLQVEFSTRTDPRELVPRACDGAFCRKHGAAWLPDPAGRQRIAFAEAQVLASYAQASQAARFRLCARCVVLVAVTYPHGDRLFVAIAATCLDDPAAFGTPVPVSPQRSSREEKTDRWGPVVDAGGRTDRRTRMVIPRRAGRSARHAGPTTRAARAVRVPGGARPRSRCRRAA